MKFDSAYDILAVGKAKLKVSTTKTPEMAVPGVFYSVKRLKLLGWLSF